MLGRSRGLFLFRPLATLQFQSPGPALSPPPPQPPYPSPLPASSAPLLPSRLALTGRCSEFRR